MAGLHAAGQLVAEVVHDTTSVTVPYRMEPSVSVRPLGQGLAIRVFVAGHNEQLLGRLRQTLTTPELLFALVFGADLERAMGRMLWAHQMRSIPSWQTSRVGSKV